MAGPLQQATGTSSGTASMVMTALAAGLTLGSLVVVCVDGVTTNSRSAPSITGVTGWTLLASSYNINSSEIWAGTVTTGGGTVCTVNAGVAHSYRGNIAEWPGYALAGSTGIGRAYASSAAGQRSTNSLTPTASAVCLLIAGGVVSTGALSEPSSSDNYTALTTSNTREGYRYQEVASASGSYTASWTTSLTASHDNSHAVFYASGGGGATKVLPEALGLHALGGLH